VWEEEANRALQRAGFQIRIDHRSLKEQGINREPEKHRGPERRRRREEGPVLPAMTMQAPMP
jgi:hypothetical protein